MASSSTVCQIKGTTQAPLGLRFRREGVEVRKLEYQTLRPDADQRWLYELEPKHATIVWGSRSSWTRDKEQLVNVSDENRGYHRFLFGDPEWQDYEFSFDFRSDDPNALSAQVRAGDAEHVGEFGLSWHGNKATLTERSPARPYAPMTMTEMIRLKPDQWYSVRVVVRGTHMEGYLDGQLIHETDEAPYDRGRVGIMMWRRSPDQKTEFRDIKVKSLGGAILWQGPPKLP